MSFSSKLIALNSKTAGKDKIYRTIQYGCKLLWYLLWKNKSNKDYIDVLKKIEAAMSNTRKGLQKIPLLYLYLTELDNFKMP